MIVVESSGRLRPHTTVFEAVKAMDKFKVDALMVIENRKLVAVISERDCTRKVVLKERAQKPPRSRKS